VIAQREDDITAFTARVRELRTRYGKRPSLWIGSTRQDCYSRLADELVPDFSFIGLFNGAPDLAERREEILREELAKRTDANR
jgi:hypothetical protein